MRSRQPLALMVVLVFVAAASATAQWLDYRAPNMPRRPDGTVNLSAPAPRAADGHPDLSGVWGGAGPMYRFNIAQDLQPGDVKPWAEALFLQRLRDSRKDSPLARCLPVSAMYHNFFNLTQFVQTPGERAVLARVAQPLQEERLRRWLDVAGLQVLRDVEAVHRAGAAPHAGEIRMAVRGARGRSGEIHRAVGQPRGTRRAVVQPLRGGWDHSQRHKHHHRRQAT